MLCCRVSRSDSSRSREERLDKLRTYIASELSEQKQAKVKVFLPNDFLSYLEDREGEGL
jgi:hypothetical protein